jgi:hypothetical protein
MCHGDLAIYYVIHHVTIGPMKNIKFSLSLQHSLRIANKPNIWGTSDLIFGQILNKWSLASSQMNPPLKIPKDLLQKI